MKLTLNESEVTHGCFELPRATSECIVIGSHAKLRCNNVIAAYKLFIVCLITGSQIATQTYVFLNSLKDDTAVLLPIIICIQSMFYSIFFEVVTSIVYTQFRLKRISVFGHVSSFSHGWRDKEIRKHDHCCAFTIIVCMIWLYEHAWKQELDCVMFSCLIALNILCEFKKLLHHIKYLHSNEPNFMISCGHCNQSFRKFESFKSHLRRKHNVNENTGENDLNLWTRWFSKCWWQWPRRGRWWNRRGKHHR